MIDFADLANSICTLQASHKAKRSTFCKSKK